MRKTTITCDVCSGPADKFLCSVTINGTVTADACSNKCQARLLRSFADDIEKKDSKRDADNRTFAAENPGAVMAGPPPEPKPGGCAACAVGMPLTIENAPQHTGQGANCKDMKGQKPCLCPPDNWKMSPPDNTPGPHEVVCHKCGNTWIAVLHPAAPAGEAAPARRRGRPPGSGKAKTETNGSNGSTTDELATLKAKRQQEEADAGALRGPGSAFAPAPGETLFAPAAPPSSPPTAPVADTPKLNRDMSLNEAPRWCGCGKPIVFVNGKWECEDKHELGYLPVRDGRPGENLSQTLADAAKFGVNVNLVDFAQWPVMKRITLSEWVRQGGKEEDRPVFLEPPPAPPPPPPPPPATGASRFTF